MRKKIVCFLSVLLTVWLLLPQGAFAASFQIDFDTACDAIQLLNLDTGTVVYAGTLALSGGPVVIDHGCGVKSYRFGMGEVLVQKGQSVTKGDQVGTATDAHDLIFELRIGSKSVDPAPAIKGASGLQFQENR